MKLNPAILNSIYSQNKSTEISGVIYQEQLIIFILKKEEEKKRKTDLINFKMCSRSITSLLVT